MLWETRESRFTSSRTAIFRQPLGNLAKRRGHSLKKPSSLQLILHRWLPLNAWQAILMLSMERLLITMEFSVATLLKCLFQKLIGLLKCTSSPLFSITWVVQLFPFEELRREMSALDMSPQLGQHEFSLSAIRVWILKPILKQMHPQTSTRTSLGHSNA